MAMALLPPQQQRNWFFIDFEDDGGIYEVEVDVVGSCAQPLSPGYEWKVGLCVFLVETDH